MRMYRRAGQAGCSGGDDERGGAAAGQAEKLTLLVADNKSGYLNYP